MAVANQLTSQKLEENPVLPLDTQANLVYVLVRIFRVIAQIVNPLVAWAASWAGIVPSGSTWGNVLTIKANQPTTGPNAALVLQAAAPTGGCVIAADRPAGTRLWDINIPTSDAAGDFSIVRWPNAPAAGATAVAINRASGNMDVYGRLGASGQIVSSSTGDAISAPNGNVSTNQMVYAGTPGLRTIGPVQADSFVSCANGMRLLWDGGNANYLWMGSGGNGWSWQWIRSTGNLSWLNNLSQQLFNIDPSGAVGAAYFSARGATGLQVIGTADDGGGSTYQDMVTGNPGWNWLAVRAWHQRGSWAGTTFQSPMNGIQFVLSNGGGWGSIRAATFDVQSDLRTKDELEEVKDACAALEGLQAWSYVWRGKPGPFEKKGKARHTGLIAQEVQKRIPQAVSGDENLTVDYAAVTAYAVQAVSELLARVNTLEQRITALETQGTP